MTLCMPARSYWQVKGRNRAAPVGARRRAGQARSYAVVFGERVMQLFPERPPMKVVLYGPVVQYPHENNSGPLVCPSFNADMLWEEGEEHIVP